MAGRGGDTAKPVTGHCHGKSRQNSVIIIYALKSDTDNRQSCIWLLSTDDRRRQTQDCDADDDSEAVLLVKNHARTQSLVAIVWSCFCLSIQVRVMHRFGERGGGLPSDTYLVVALGKLMVGRTDGRWSESSCAPSSLSTCRSKTTMSDDQG